jgi:hypothetical protein
MRPRCHGTWSHTCDDRPFILLTMTYLSETAGLNSTVWLGSHQSCFSTPCTCAECTLLPSPMPREPGSLSTTQCTHLSPSLAEKRGNNYRTIESITSSQGSLVACSCMCLGVIAADPMVGAVHNNGVSAVLQHPAHAEKQSVIQRHVCVVVACVCTV